MTDPDFTAIPVVDIAALQSGDKAGIQSVAGEIAKACETAGFLYVKNHGIPPEVVSGVFDAAHWFFWQPQAERDAIDLSRSRCFRGYVPMGIVGPNVPRRLLEAFQMMLDLPADDPDVRAGNVMYGANVWPRDAAAFRKAMDRYYEEVWALSERLLGAFAVGLGLDADYFRPFFRKPLTQLRLLHYPPQPKNAEALGVEAHTDTGAFTILLQDDAGGLEVRNRAGDWIAAAPVAGTFVINIADMMQRWTNGRFVSTPHRVANRTGADRISVPFFANPDYAATVVPLGGSAGGYEPLACGPYVEKAYRAAWPLASPAA
ncbi:MAG: 2OG-Fe(II) oxygenase family protein [Bauldia sp.]